MTTPRYSLPELANAQAQPEISHNEAIRALEQVAQTSVIDKDLSTPPGSPSDGDAYIVAATATGAWAGHEDDVAYYSGGWEFFTPQAGHLAYVQDEATLYQFGVAWAELAIGGGAASTDSYDTAAPAAGVLDLSDPAVSVWVINLNGNVTSIVLPSAATGEALSLILLFKQDGVGGRTVSGWPTITWEAGSAPTISSTANEMTSVPLLVLGNGDIYGV